MSDETRRGFLKQAGCAAAIGTVAGSTAAALGQPQPRRFDTPPAKPSRAAIGGGLSPAYSRAVAYGDLVFVAGVVGVKPGTREIPKEFADEVRQTLDNLKASVEAAGSTFERVLKCTVFLTDFEQFAPFNEIYMKSFPKEPPARSTVVVKAIVIPGAHVEIDCVTTR
jgi:2-iminobutanoate/2-iminopropanoate deaminase